VKLRSTIQQLRRSLSILHWRTCRCHRLRSISIESTVSNRLSPHDEERSKGMSDSCRDRHGNETPNVQYIALPKRFLDSERLGQINNIMAKCNSPSEYYVQVDAHGRAFQRHQLTPASSRLDFRHASICVIIRRCMQIPSAITFNLLIWLSHAVGYLTEAVNFIRLDVYNGSSSFRNI